MAEDIFFSDAARGTGASNLREIDVVLLGDLANQRRRASAFTSRCRGCSRSRRGCRCGSRAAAAAGAAFAGAAAALPAPPPMTATTVLIVTVLPSSTLISVRVPATGEGISASTLSVDISKIGSSRWTVSPTFFSHLVMVPSVMDSPICGIRTSVPPPCSMTVPAAAESASAGLPWVAAGASSAAGVTVSAAVLGSLRGQPGPNRRRRLRHRSQRRWC